jgi:hypothetical protein
MFQDVVSGAVGGLISTVIIVLFGTIWSKTLIPWFEELVYKAARIEGDWCGEVNYDDGNTEEFEFKILRQSYRIFGSMQSVENRKEYPCVSIMSETTSSLKLE